MNSSPFNSPQVKFGSAAAWKGGNSGQLLQPEIGAGGNDGEPVEVVKSDPLLSASDGAAEFLRVARRSGGESPASRPQMLETGGGCIATPVTPEAIVAAFGTCLAAGFAGAGAAAAAGSGIEGSIFEEEGKDGGQEEGSDGGHGEVKEDTEDTCGEEGRVD